MVTNLVPSLRLSTTLPCWMDRPGPVPAATWEFPLDERGGKNYNECESRVAVGYFETNLFFGCKYVVVQHAATINNNNRST